MLSSGVVGRRKGEQSASALIKCKRRLKKPREYGSDVAQANKESVEKRVERNMVQGMGLMAILRAGSGEGVGYSRADGIILIDSN